MSKTKLEALKAARALIADPDHWTTGSFARTRGGNPIGCDTPNAACWCAMGAIARVSIGEDWANSAAFSLLEHICFARSGKSVPDFNDHSTHAEVLELFDLAIKAAEVDESYAKSEGGSVEGIPISQLPHLQEQLKNSGPLDIS